MRRWLFVLAVIGAIGSLDAPSSRLSAAERIAAVVNKEVILESDVQEQMQEAGARMNLDPSDSVAVAKLHKDVLDQMVEKQVLLAEVSKQSITVTPAEVNAGVDREIDALKQRLGSEEQYRQALAHEKTTEADLRKKYEPNVREQLLIQRLVGREVQSKITVSDAEVRAYYEAHRDSIGRKPESVKLAHILIAFEPD